MQHHTYYFCSGFPNGQLSVCRSTLKFVERYSSLSYRLVAVPKWRDTLTHNLNRKTHSLLGV